MLLFCESILNCVVFNFITSYCTGSFSVSYKKFAYLSKCSKLYKYSHIKSHLSKL